MQKEFTRKRLPPLEDVAPLPVDVVIPGVAVLWDDDDYFADED